MKNYGEALKYQREISGLNQTELAKKVGTSQQNIGRWENNEVLPNIDFCVRLATFYGISVNELLGISDGGTVPTAAPMGNAVGESLTIEEHNLITKYRKLSPDLKEMLNGIIGTWTGGTEPAPTKKKV